MHKLKAQLQPLEREAPLHLAVNKRDIPMIKTLLHLGADPEIKSEGGLTPRELAEKKRLDMSAFDTTSEQ